MNASRFTSLCALAAYTLVGCAATSPYESLKPGITIEKDRICAAACHEIGSLDTDTAYTFASSEARHDLTVYLTNPTSEYDAVLMFFRDVKYTQEDNNACVKVCAEEGSRIIDHNQPRANTKNSEK